VRLEGLGKLKKSTSSGIRSRDLPACSVVPQPATLPRTPPPRERYLEENTSSLGLIEGTKGQTILYFFLFMLDYCDLQNTILKVCFLHIRRRSIETFDFHEFTNYISSNASKL
jgi:hypothetical protein